MDKSEWTEQITEAMRTAGTYRETYDAVIDTLADILERRDTIRARWVREGRRVMVTKTSDRGAKNKTKNPLLTLLQEHEADALKYWTELGMTPKSLKAKFSEDEEERKSGSALVKALADLSRA
jgi:phage terminase small subunit